MENIKKYYLDFDKTYSYFLSHIQCGWTLDKEISLKINFLNDKFFTVLPKEIINNNIYNFENGILKLKRNDLAFDNTIRNEFYLFFLNFLKNEKNIAIIDLYISDNLKKEVRDNSFKYLEKECYCLLDSKSTLTEISAAINKSDLEWHFLAVLTRGFNKKTESFKPSDFITICNNVCYIVTTAYDGEGYIFWEKIIKSE